MRGSRIILLLAVLLLPAAACNDSATFIGPAPADDVLIFESGSEALAAASVSALEIDGVSVRESLILLDVTYDGGCAEHRFALHASSSFLESFPAQAVLVLSHDDGGEACTEPQATSLIFDLSELEQVYRSSYNDDGPLELRLFGPGKIEPLRPLPRFEF